MFSQGEACGLGGCAAGQGANGPFSPQGLRLPLSLFRPGRGAHWCIHVCPAGASCPWRRKSHRAPRGAAAELVPFPEVSMLQNPRSRHAPGSAGRPPAPGAGPALPSGGWPESMGLTCTQNLHPRAPACPLGRPPAPPQLPRCSHANFGSGLSSLCLYFCCFSHLSFRWASGAQGRVLGPVCSSLGRPKSLFVHEREPETRESPTRDSIPGPGSRPEPEADAPALGPQAFPQSAALKVGFVGRARLRLSGSTVDEAGAC